jgi:chromosome segregation ATPase
MDWQSVASIGAVFVTGVLGFLTYRRGKSSDTALNVATNVQSTYSATLALVDQLQEEVTRLQRDVGSHRTSLLECEENSSALRRKLAERNEMVSDQEHQIKKLQRTVADHEVTIDRHERTIERMSRRTDTQTPRVDDEERRHD